MERLTDKRMKGEGFIPVDQKEYKAFVRNEKPSGKQIYKRLLEIEDILGDEYDLERLKVLVNQRMTMREEVAERFSITKDIPVDRLKWLVEADKNGMFIAVPCKVGDTVYVITNKDGCLCCGKEIVKCEVNTMRVKSDGITIGYSCRGKYGNGNNYIGNFVFKSIGKTVFLTREAAEEALKEVQHA